MRRAEIKRKTNETDIVVAVNLDGTGVYDIETGIGFLDHMLDQLSKHSLIDIDVRAKGDLHIAFHHTAEDVGIALGEAVKKALGDKKGIRRYASAGLVMDGTLTRVALDVSGRPFLVWQGEFCRGKVGDMDPELFRGWLQGFAMNCGIALHGRAGENSEFWSVCPVAARRGRRPRLTASRGWRRRRGRKRRRRRRK